MGLRNVVAMWIAALWMLVVVGGCGPRRSSATAATVEGPPPCPRSLRALVPANARSWVLLRPSAIHEHPQLGAIVARSIDAAGDRALTERAARVGYDVRSLDRALVAWTPRAVLYAAHGAMPTERVTTLLWDRLLTPRVRNDDRWNNVRLTGVLARTTIATVLRPQCSLAAYAERDARLADRLFLEAAGDDPDALITWNTEHLPDELAQREAALSRFVRGVTVTVRAASTGVDVELVLQGNLPDDAPERLRRAVDAIAQSELGDLTGAVQWAQGERLLIARTVEATTLRVQIPWRALSAIADAMRGSVEIGPPP